ncbi:MAG: prolipoprotein diacylglyceryl transferase [Chloroflexi bacterium]|nr:MAG: prolipoprotein diacylglyceryl transferase [Chloroflexota bacterium]
MPSSFKIGPLTIQLYGVLIMLGALAAAWLSTKEAKRRGINSDVVWDMFPWLIIGGIIGARLWHILTPSASLVAQGITTWYYLTHPLDAIAIWKGGLGIPGAVIGGAVALWLYARKRKMNFGAWTDIIAPGLALAQAIGRLGNYVNQELYGAPTDLPWALTIDEAHRLPEYIDQATYHPLFAYEAIYNLINMAVLLWIGRKFGDRLKTGDIFLAYLVIYPVGRFFLEFLRLDPSPVAGININQTIMAVIAVAATAVLIFRHQKKASAPSQPEAPAS